MLLLLLACQAVPQDTAANTDTQADTQADTGSDADTQTDTSLDCAVDGVWAADGEGWVWLETGPKHDVTSLLLEEDTTLRVCGGPLFLTIETNGFDLVVDGEDGVLSAAGQWRLLKVIGGSVSLSGITIQSGIADRGGCVYAEDATVSLSSGAVLDCSAEEEGGGLYLSGGSAELFDMSIKDNRSDGAGGGAVFSGGEVLIEQTGFSRNQADRAGGMLLTDGVVLTGVSVGVEENLATNGAGVMVKGSATVAFTDAHLTDNMATASGAGVAMSGGELTFNGRLNNNAAAEMGGGLWLSDEAQVVLDAAVFVENTAAFGGGIAMAEASVSGSGCDFTDNTPQDMWLEVAESGTMLTEGFSCDGTGCTPETRLRAASAPGSSQR
ncbi:MAG: right-handed parallel beta-helix repeat-containing protein [Myxococcota bacterium]|nr:right-handed parallel beta-helix repeat-containing protein [Myxococcota bacterium]